MVKLSRRQVKKRSLKRRTAKKRVMKRRVMKGGLYTDFGTYNRYNTKYVEGKETPQIVYELTSRDDGTGNTVYNLNFKKSNATFTGIPDLAIKFKYKNIFKTAFKVTSSSSKKLIDEMIEKLFEGGIPGVKTRQLEITDMAENTFVSIKILEGESEIHSVSLEKGSTDVKFKDFLTSLGDEIMPIPSNL